MRFRKILDPALTFIFTTLILSYGFLSGFRVSELSVDNDFLVLNILYMDAISSTLIFSLFIGFFGLLLLKEIYWTKPPEKITDGRSVLAIIPIYKEANILHKSIQSLKQCEYQDVTICVVCEEDDKKSIQRAGELGCEVLINNHPGSKAGAMNTAFEEKRNFDYYTVLDADEEVENDFLSRAIGRIEEGGYEALEGRRVPETRGIVEVLSYCERFIFNILFKFMEVTGFRNLGSSAVVMKREVWEKTGGFGDMLTEDIDFHHKTFRAGINAVNDRTCNTVMEAPHTWTDFWKQRKRWRKGWVQVFHKTITGGYDNYLSIRGIYSTTRIIMGLVGVFSILFIVPKMIVLFLLDLRFFYLLPLVVMSALTALGSYKDNRLDKVDFVGFNAIMSIFVLPITSFLTLKAIIEYALKGEGEWYQVEKGK